MVTLHENHPGIADDSCHHLELWNNENSIAEENNWKYVLFNPTIMPPKRSAIGRSTNQAKRRREERASETSEQRQARQERDRVHTALARSLETSEQRQARQQRNRIRRTQTRRTIHTYLNLCGFNYNPLYNYSLHPSVIIGKMDKKPTYCGAQKFKNETPDMCYAGGKVKLPDLRSPPKPLLTLVSGETSQSNNFF
uniref:Uncharacterized protein n=1 Tax=Rhodnius prolixus TaxID=13249 RepID=T1I9R8_RHOPR